MTTPFLYDPAAGNLVFDTVSGDPAIGGVGIGSSTATTGNMQASHVTQLTFEPPPKVTIRTSQVEVCWNSKSNLTYQVQYRSDVTTNRWASLGSCVQGSGSINCLNGSIVLGQPQRFYRVLLTNCVPD